MTTQSQVTKITVYWDEQDPQNIGWAYRAIVSGAEESGEVGIDATASLEDAAIQAAWQLGIELRGDEFAMEPSRDGGCAVWEEN